MTKNPVVNALGASAYIVLVVAVMNYLSQTHRNTPDTVMAPILFLSMFTLSAAVMALLFFYQPLMLFIDGKKKAAVHLLIRTMAVFAGITGLILALFLTGVLK